MFYVTIYHAAFFEIFVNVLAFLYEKVNSKESVKKYHFLLFKKNADVNILLEFKAYYLEKTRGYPKLSLLILIAFAKICFFRVILTWPKIPLYLVGALKDAYYYSVLVAEWLDYLQL